MQETVKLEYTSWWGTEGCRRGGIICGNHCGTSLMDAVAATHSVVVVALLAALLRSSTDKKKTAYPQALNENCSRIRWASLVERAVLLISACKAAVPNVEGSCLSEWVGVSGGSGNAVNDPCRKNAFQALFRFY